MQYRTACPQCLSNVNDVDLKNNRTLDEMVTVMKRLREPLCKALKGVPQGAAAPIMQTPSTSKVSAPPESPARTPSKDSPRPSAPQTPKQSSPVKILTTPKSHITHFLSPKKSTPTTPARSSTSNKLGFERLGLTQSTSTQSQTKPEIRVRSMETLTNPPLSPPKPVTTHGILGNVSMVTCPICQVEIPERNINIHIDKCLERSNQDVVAAIK
jgi:hypothetical protein